MIDTINKGLRRFGLSLQKVQSKNKLINILEIIVRDTASKYPNGTVVQVGANDGVHNDPIRSILVSNPFNAVCIEPMPDLASTLRANYRELSHVRIREHAIGTEPGQLTLYRIDPNHAHYPFWARGTISADPKIFRKDRRLRKIARSAIVQLQVPMMTLKQVVQEEKIDDILLLQIDIEGFDDHVIFSAFDQGLKPRLINYEHKHLSFERQTVLRDRLNKEGYALASWNGDDTLAQFVEDAY